MRPGRYDVRLGIDGDAKESQEGSWIYDPDRMIQTGRSWEKTPVGEGLYWYRRMADFDRPTVVLVFLSAKGEWLGTVPGCLSNLRIGNMTGEWWGPLAPPGWRVKEKE